MPLLLLFTDVLFYQCLPSAISACVRTNWAAAVLPTWALQTPNPVFPGSTCCISAYECQRASE